MKRLMLVIGLAVTASAILVPSLAQAADPPKKLDVMLYVDTVNGSRPVGREAAADQLHADQRLYARRAAGVPCLGHRRRQRRHPLDRERQVRVRDGSRVAEPQDELGLARL